MNIPEKEYALVKALQDTLWGIEKLKERTGLDLERSYPVYFDHLPRARKILESCVVHSTSNK